MNTIISAEFASCILRAQKAITGAIKDKQNEFVGNKYADLTTVIDAVKKPLNDNDIIFVHKIEPDGDNSMLIQLLLVHVTGEAYTAASISMPILRPTEVTVTDDAGNARSKRKGMSVHQAIGVAISYARRYTLASALGVPMYDNDGNDHNQQVIHTYFIPNIKPAQEEFMYKCHCTYDTQRGVWESTQDLGDKLKKYKV